MPELPEVETMVRGFGRRWSGVSCGGSRSSTRFLLHGCPRMSWRGTDAGATVERCRASG